MELRPTSLFPRWEVDFVLRTEKLEVVWHRIHLGFTLLGAGRGVEPKVLYLFWLSGRLAA